MLSKLSIEAMKPHDIKMMIGIFFKDHAILCIFTVNNNILLKIKRLKSFRENVTCVKKKPQQIQHI